MPEITFCGETFTLPATENTMALMEYSAVAVRGVDTGSIEGLAALHNLLEGCVAEEDWPRFKALARKHRTSGDDLWEAVKEVYAAYADRPTGQPSESSDGLTTIEPSSEVVSSSPKERAQAKAKAQLESQGRPDLALVVMQAQQAS